MILADTSVWVDHFRRGNKRLRNLLEAGEVATHTMVIGELACGRLQNRAATLELLGNLPRLSSVENGLVMEAIQQHRLWSRGLSWVDLHLLMASRISGVGLWTLDRRLAQVV